MDSGTPTAPPVTDPITSRAPPELFALLHSEPTADRKMSPQPRILVDFRKFLKIHDLDRKINVAESVRGDFYGAQAVRTRLETTPRHHQSLHRVRPGRRTVHKLARDNVSTVPTTLRGDWRSQNRYSAQLQFLHKVWAYNLKIFL